jgi:hypothetical protein
MEVKQFPVEQGGVERRRKWCSPAGRCRAEEVGACGVGEAWGGWLGRIRVWSVALGPGDGPLVYHPVWWIASATQCICVSSAPCLLCRMPPSPGACLCLLHYVPPRHQVPNDWAKSRNDWAKSYEWLSKPKEWLIEISKISNKITK